MCLAGLRGKLIALLLLHIWLSPIGSGPARIYFELMPLYGVIIVFNGQKPLHLPVKIPNHSSKFFIMGSYAFELPELFQKYQWLETELQHLHIEEEGVQKLLSDPSPKIPDTHCKSAPLYILSHSFLSSGCLPQGKSLEIGT